MSCCRLSAQLPAAWPRHTGHWDCVEDVEVALHHHQVLHQVAELPVAHQEVGRDGVLLLILHDGHHLYEVSHCVAPVVGD